VSFLFFFIYCSATINARKIIKVLPIENSFSEDASEAYLDDLAGANGIKPIVGKQ